MAPLIVLVATFLLLTGIDVPTPASLDPTTSLRISLAVMLLFTAAAHFNRMRDDLVRMVPPAIPRAGLVVTITGVLEIVGAIGLLIPATAPAAAIALIVLLVAMFPANVHAAQRGALSGGRRATPIGVRTALQALWIGCLAWVAWGAA
jgi:uncharacterized membrane protein